MGTVLGWPASARRQAKRRVQEPEAF